MSVTGSILNGGAAATAIGDDTIASALVGAVDGGTTVDGSLTILGSIENGGALAVATGQASKAKSTVGCVGADC